jgi:CheY-like chemotaxis protein
VRGNPHVFGELGPSHLEKSFINLPIIALTAKAMKTDRDKRVEAGASDYIAKPIDMDQLLSMLRVRLNQLRVASV